MNELVEALKKINGVSNFIEVGGKKHATMLCDSFKKMFCDREHTVNYDGTYLTVSVEQDGIVFRTLMNFDEYKDYLMYF